MNNKKTPKHCDLDLNNWKDYINDITTNGLWLSNVNTKPMFGKYLIPNRADIPENSLKSTFHGIWISEIPYQMIMRFTKENDNIWSIFGGTGIDYKVAQHLNRNCFINDISPTQDFIIQGDSRNINPDTSFKMILAHPPYWNIIKYSDMEEDGSSKLKLDEFLIWWDEILINVDKYLEADGYFILVCGNIYKNGEEISLGEILKNMVLSKGYILKQHIIKDYGETKGSNLKNYNLNYYRQLKGGYGNFYGDNIFILKKRKSKNKITELLIKHMEINNENK